MQKNTFSISVLIIALFSIILLGGGCKKDKQIEANLTTNSNPDIENVSTKTTIDENIPFINPGTTNPSVIILIEGEDETEPNETTSEAEIKNDEQASAPTIKEFTMIAKKWDFEPSSITVNKGDTVKLTIKSIDVDHGFAISQFGVNTTLVPGKTETIEFIADKAGTFSFFCSIFCGSGHGTMRGTLIVN